MVVYGVRERNPGVQESVDGWCLKGMRIICCEIRCCSRKSALKDIKRYSALLPVQYRRQNKKKTNTQPHTHTCTHYFNADEFCALLLDVFSKVYFSYFFKEVFF